MTYPILRTSERRDFKRCPTRWWWAYRDGLQAMGAPPLNLWFGIGVHVALANYYLPGYKRGPHPAETWEKFYADEAGLFLKTLPNQYIDEEKWEDVLPLGISMLEGYVDLYQGDPGWEVLAPEEICEILVPVDDSYVRYVLTYDLVFIDHNELRPMIKLGEHKTCKTISTGHLSLDPQAGSYHAVANQVLRKRGWLNPNQKIKGIEYNFLRKAMPDLRPIGPTGHRHNKPTKQHFVDALIADGQIATMSESAARLQERCKNMEVFGEISKTQPSPLFHREFIAKTRREDRRQIEQIQIEARHMQAHKDHKGAMLYKNQQWNCSWDCQFKELCEMHEASPDWTEFRDSMFHSRDPYAQYRKSSWGD